MAETLKTNDELGFFIKPENQEHSFTIPVQYLNIVNIGIPHYDNRPDISVIILPSTTVNTIKAAKSFYPITSDSYPEEINSENKKDPLFICGVPDIRTKKVKSMVGIETMMSYELLCGPSVITNYYSIEEFDYLEIGVDYITGSNLPETFGGVSGGGVWRVPIRISPSGEKTVIDHFLTGMVFYQTERKNNHRGLICHGPKSIYEIVRENLIPN